MKELAGRNTGLLPSLLRSGQWRHAHAEKGEINYNQKVTRQQEHETKRMGEPTG